MNDGRVALGLGFSGAHRTGKTTAAKKFAEDNQVPFIASSSSAIAKDMGFDIRAGTHLSVRRPFQERVLTSFTEAYEAGANNGLFVSDRTPLDMAAYTLADWHPSSTDDDLNEWIMDYVKRCKEVTSKYFFMLGIVQPGIAFVEESGKAENNQAYIELLNTLTIGLCADSSVNCHYLVLPRTMTDLQRRVTTMSVVMNDRLNKYQERIAETMTPH